MAEITPSSAIDAVYLVRPNVHGDNHGFPVETYIRSWEPVHQRLPHDNMRT